MPDEDQLTGTKVRCHQEAGNKHKCSQQPEEVHRALSEPGDEADRQHVKIALQKPVETVFGDPVLACTVLDNLLADLPESRFPGKHRDIPVHLAVDLDAFNYLCIIGLEPAVEIVQPDARELPCSVIVQFGGGSFNKRIVSLLLPP